MKVGSFGTAVLTQPAVAEVEKVIGLIHGTGVGYQVISTWYLVLGTSTTKI
jgi:hypothetical protein